MAVVYMIIEWRYDEAPDGRRPRKSRTPYRSPFTALQARLPDFDNRALIEAMGLMEGGRVLWQRTPSSS